MDDQYNPLLPTGAQTSVSAPVPLPPRHTTSKRGLWTVLVIILILAGGAYAWLWLNPPAPAEQTASPTPTTTADAMAGVKMFESQTLGIRFSYVATEGDPIVESGNKVFVGGATGQSVEVFAKRTDESFEQSIKRQILEKYPSEDCKVEVTPSNILGGYQVAEISYPRSSDESEPWFENYELCNPNYDQTNGIRYFLYNPEYPDRFYFFSIGQYAIRAELSGQDGGGRAWQDTFEVFK